MCNCYITAFVVIVHECYSIMAKLGRQPKLKHSVLQAQHYNAQQKDNQIIYCAFLKVPKQSSLIQTSISHNSKNVFVGKSTTLGCLLHST